MERFLSGVELFLLASWSFICIGSAVIGGSELGLYAL